MNNFSIKKNLIYIVTCLFIFACSHTQTKEEKQKIKKIFYANSEIEITDSILFDRIRNEVASNNSELIHSNLQYDKQLQCVKLYNKLISILRDAEKLESPASFSLSDFTFDNEEIDTNATIKIEHDEFAACDIILLNTKDNTIEAMVLGLNEFDSIDYSAKVDNLCFYPIAINEGLLLDKKGHLDSTFIMLFSLDAGIMEKSVIFSLDRNIYKNYFEELSFVSTPNTLVDVPSKCDFRTLLNFYSFIINEGIVKDYSLIGKGVQKDKSDFLNQNVFTSMKSIPSFTSGLVFISFNTFYCFASNENNILCIKMKLLDEKYSYDYKSHSGKGYSRFPFSGCFTASLQIHLIIIDFLKQINSKVVSE